MSETWETAEAIAEARSRFEAAIPGWRRPAAYGLGRVDDGRIEFVRANDGEHYLPAVVLATVCGYSNETGSYPMTPADLSRSIDLIAPAEACTAYEHPNLWAWRALLPKLGETDRLAAVFVADWDTAGDDPHVSALKAALDR